MLMGTAALVLMFGTAKHLPVPVVVEQKPQPRYIKNPAGGTPLSTAENPVLPTTPVADQPPAELAPTVIPESAPEVQALIPVATVPTAEEVTPAPTPPPRPPKRERPTVVVSDAPGAPRSEPVTAQSISTESHERGVAQQPKLLERRQQRAEEHPEPQEQMLAPAPKPPPARQVDNPWDTPTDTGFNQK